MQKNSPKNPFIVFEGLDGCGKSTQMKILSRWLHQQEIKHIFAREPGTTEIGEKIRYLLKNNTMTPQAQLLLLNASRSMLLEHIHKMQSTHWIICDRFNYSTWAYQHYTQNIPAEDLLCCEKLIKLDIKPDLVLFFKHQYRKQARDSFEELSTEKVLYGYEQQMDDNWIVLPNLSIDALAEEIKTIIQKQFNV